jgi:hypothetical protein
VSNRADRVYCKVCGGHRDEVGIISHTGKCVECGKAILKDNILGLHYHRGPAFDRWRRGIAASVGATFTESTSETG